MVTAPLNDDKGHSLSLPEGMGTVLIKVSLVLDGDTLKGSWTNPEDGSSDVVEVARKK